MLEGSHEATGVHRDRGGAHRNRRRRRALWRALAIHAEIAQRIRPLPHREPTRDADALARSRRPAGVVHGLAGGWYRGAEIVLLHVPARRHRQRLGALLPFLVCTAPWL